MPLATIYKYAEDQGNYLAAIITYYAFLAIFPLMLLATSILGFVLQGDPALQRYILDSALGRFPIVGEQLGRPEGLQGSVGGIVVGLLTAVYGALGLGVSIQNAMNVAWSVPRINRPDPFFSRLRSLVLLVTAGVSVLALTVFSALGSNTDVFGAVIGDGLRLLIRVANVVVVGLVLTVLFRLAAARQHSFAKAMPGAFVVAILWLFLQDLGTLYATRILAGTSSMNQTFGLVLGLLGIIYIAAVVTIFGMEINVVLARRLYPRALLAPFTDAVRLTEADRRAYTAYGAEESRQAFERIEVFFDDRVATQPAELQIPAEPAGSQIPAEPAGSQTPAVTSPTTLSAVPDPDPDPREQKPSA